MTTIDKTTISIPNLVTVIKETESAVRCGRWTEVARCYRLIDAQTLSYMDRFPGTNYRAVETLTGLYTLRAWLRGKLHRLNPPAQIRDYNRAMRETGRVEQEWDAAKHNRELAEKWAPKFPVPVPSVEECEIAESLGAALKSAPGVDVRVRGGDVVLTATG